MARDKGSTATVNAPIPMTQPAPTAPAHGALTGLPPITEHADLRALEANLARLHGRRTEALTKQGQLTKRLHELRTATVESRFADALTTNPDAPQADPKLVSLSAEHDAVVQELAAVDRAIKTMTDSVGPIETLKAELCGAACRAVATLHRQRARAVVNALLTLYHASGTQQETHEELNRLGYHRTSGLTGFFVTDFGRLSDSGSWVSALFRDATTSGLISEDERIAITRGEMAQINPQA